MMKLFCALQLFLLVGVLFLSGCGIAVYPGQPGVVTNGSAKIDLENLDESGLYVYEVAYDNSKGGKGVGAIITKRYPNAKTYTSNVRTNSEGTVYRAKGAYQGAKVEMISIPSLNQILVAPDSTVAMLIEYTASVDEVDDRNLAEEGLFADVMPAPLSAVARAARKFRWDLMRAGSLTASGNLSYEIASLKLGNAQFTPSKPVKLETNLIQTAVRTDMTAAIREEAKQFLENNFPKGFSGKVSVNVKGTSQPVEISLGLHSLKTAAAAGKKIIVNASDELIAETLRTYNAN